MKLDERNSSVCETCKGQGLINHGKYYTDCAVCAGFGRVPDTLRLCSRCNPKEGR